MTIEERVSRLERQIDQLDRIEARLSSMDTRLGHVEDAVVGLRKDFADFRVDQARILERILFSIDALQHRPILFRWPWEHSQTERTS